MNSEGRFPFGWIVALAFSVTLAAILGFRLASAGVMTVVFGLVVGVSVGVITGAAVSRIGLPRQRDDVDPQTEAINPGQTVIVLSDEQADTLIDLINTRRQASPRDFPMVADRSRDFTAVGGAELDDPPDG